MASDVSEHEFVIGLDMSLTGPGIARLSKPWGDELPHAVATTLDRVPSIEAKRGLVLLEAAERIARRALSLVGGNSADTLVVMEAVLLQSTTGKPIERAALWWQVRGQLELRGFDVASVHPTSRRSIAMDAVARSAYNAYRGKPSGKGKFGKDLVLQSVRRQWPGVVLPDDNAADALVCASVGAHALGWRLPLQDAAKAQIKSLGSAAVALAIDERKTL